MSQSDNTSFYQRLFQFARSSESDRERREDFLTEIIAELLRQLVKSHHRDELRSLFQDVLLGKATNTKKVGSFVAHLANPDVAIEVSAQQVTPEKRRPDIVLRCEGKVFCIIENKLASPFTKKQLLAYDRHLIQQQSNTEQPEPALILITQFTRPPKDFMDQSSNYQTRVRGVAYWWQIAYWIDEQLAQQDSVGSEWGPIADQLRKLMEKWNMTVKDLSLDDLATLRLLLASGTKNSVVSAFSKIRQELTSRHPKPHSFKRGYPRWGDGYPIYEDLIEDNQGDFVFGWGVVFESEQQRYFLVPLEPAVPEQDLAFCYLWVGSDFPNNYIGKYQGWHVPQSLDDDDYIYRICDLRERVSSSDGFIKGMAAWVDESLKQAREIYERL